METSTKKINITLKDIRDSIPKECYEKDLFKSLSYMMFDIGMWAVLWYGMNTLVNNSLWLSLSLGTKGIITFSYWLSSGFFMWCVFCGAGHDCGHTTFSNYTIINDICGNICHGSLLVPYWPWRLSHHRHHMYHNHEYKDYSHPWYTAEKLSNPKAASARYVDNHPALRLLFPIIGWPLYLLGFPDGSHFIPLSGRLYKNVNLRDAIQCIISTLVVIGFGATYWNICNSDLQTFAHQFLGSYFVFAWWLTTVTYLQHHGENTNVYDETTWNFLESAFETVDRTYGWPIDDLTHDITRSHLLHHIFFTKIPHYNLRKGTLAMRKYLKEVGHGHLYKHEDTRDFPIRVFKTFYNKGFRANLVSKKYS